MNHLIDRFEHGGVVGQIFFGKSEIRFVERKLHAVRSFGDRVNEQMKRGLRGLNDGSFRVHIPAGFRTRLETRRRLIDVRVAGERRCIFSYFFFPRRAIHPNVRDGLRVLLRRLARKIGGLVLLRDLHLDVGFYFGELFQSALVSLVGLVPEHGADGVGIVIDRYGGGAEFPEVEFAANLTGVIEAVVAHAKIGIEVAMPVLRAVLQLAERAADREVVRFGDFVTDEIGRNGLRFELDLRTRHLGFDRVQHG